MNFLMKAMLKRQLAQLPKEQQEMIITMIEKNPKLFEKISEEIKVKIKNGIPKQTASMSVFMSHKDEIQKLMMEQQK
ncbi:MAG: hypothetical protein KBD10_00620 [Candidatus Pacebacteria bacterium]|nr:hypothetical protein [Candidatus Paceibacterota bacterium]